MLADINLLPKKERKSYAFLAASAVVALVFTGVLSIMLWQIQSVKAEKEAVRERVEDVRNLRLEAEKHAASGGSASSAAMLQEAVGWAESSRLPTVFFLEHITSLLPERGYLMKFDYKEETHSVTLIAQFDTNRESAYFLNRLKGSSYVMSAELLTLASLKLEEEPDSGLPRYLGEYKLLLNTLEIQQAALEGEQP
ncbi:hypothetical protein [Bacillus marinisedimentorum]|uniref:hypothetical protein n=1 Tax=Bacillus marinisedimentorum TaxID=1821260 RepID=UPI0008728F2B|nr:hypothetical protein [Bacillus marinisedimentorum]